jgi:hypothetical protein
MALAPVLTKWSQQLTTGEDTTFTIETQALAATTAIYTPIFRFHNIGNEAAEIQIVYTLNLGTATDDPLNSGTYSNTVVDTTVPAGAMYTYDFDGMVMTSRSSIVITHEVTITNVGISTHVFHSTLTGSTEIQTQLSAGQSIVS